MDAQVRRLAPQAKWTEDQRDIIAAMLRDKKTALQIGEAFRVSRNTIIGLVYRDKRLKEIGFFKGNRRPPKPVAKPKKDRPPKPKAERKPSKVPLAPWFPPRKSEFFTAGRPLVEIGGHQCRFAVNDADPGQSHLFCGAPADGNYCDHHRARAYQRGAE